MPCSHPYFEKEIRTSKLNIMPCSDSGGPHDFWQDESREWMSEKIRLNSKITSLQSGLCAVINELEKRGITHEVLLSASKNGQINLLQFWEDHLKSDEARIAVMLHSQFSDDEKKIIKKLLS